MADVDIPVVILCGGQGTRLREETEFKPKPMVPVGDRPLLWHIMKHYAHFGFKRFILCLGYRGESIKDYFYHYGAMNSDFTVQLGRERRVEIHASPEEDWSVTLADTGSNAQTGARVKKIERYVDTPRFCLTYGDGVSNVNLTDLLAFHRAHGKRMTLTGVHPPSRFGELNLAESHVTAFAEKPNMTAGYINGGFMICEREVFDDLSPDDDCILERAPMERLAAADQLMAYQHEGFWQCMDTLRDVKLLNELWESGRAPWRIWDGAERRVSAAPLEERV